MGAFDGGRRDIECNAVALGVPSHLLAGAEHIYAVNAARRELQRIDRRKRDRALGAAEEDCVKRISFSGVTHILPGVRLVLVLAEDGQFLARGERCAGEGGEGRKGT